MKISYQKDTRARRQGSNLAPRAPRAWVERGSRSVASSLNVASSMLGMDSFFPQDPKGNRKWHALVFARLRPCHLCRRSLRRASGIWRNHGMVGDVAWDASSSAVKPAVPDQQSVPVNHVSHRSGSWAAAFRPGLVSLNCSHVKLQSTHHEAAACGFESVCALQAISLHVACPRARGDRDARCVRSPHRPLLPANISAQCGKRPARFFLLLIRWPIGLQIDPRHRRPDWGPLTG